jgi:hypothetical protein
MLKYPKYQGGVWDLNPPSIFDIKRETGSLPGIPDHRQGMRCKAKIRLRAGALLRPFDKLPSIRLRVCDRTGKLSINSSDD